MSVQDGCVDLFSGSIRVFVDMDGIQKLKILENVGSVAYTNLVS